MSAYMVNNRTLTKIAKYMAACANYNYGNDGLTDLELDDDFKKLLSDNGLKERESGLFSDSLIHKFLFEENKKAIVARYGNDEEMVDDFKPMEDGGTAIDISKENRKVWLANLYTVCRCYLYQIEEGDFQENDFFWKFRGWIQRMADVLAMMVVNEVRPRPPSPAYKSWDEF